MPLDLDYDGLLNLIKAVSDSTLKSFSLEQSELKIIIEADRLDIAGKIPSEALAGLINMPISYNSSTRFEAQADQGWQIKAPLVGTFFRSPDVDADPYVSVGDSIKKGSTLGIIEAMKIFNEIESDVDGIVEKIMVSNGQVVGFNEPLFIIKV